MSIVYLCLWLQNNLVAHEIRLQFGQILVFLGCAQCQLVLINCDLNSLITLTLEDVYVLPT